MCCHTAASKDAMTQLSKTGPPERPRAETQHVTGCGARGQLRARGVTRGTVLGAYSGYCQYDCELEVCGLC